MKPILDKVIFENNENYDIINFYNILSLDILKLNNKELNEGIWNILNHYKENYPFIQAGYKQYYSITQLFSNFEKNPIFCFKYYSLEGCSYCTESIAKETFLSPIFNFDNIYINQFNIVDLIKNFIKNENSTCPKYGYYNDKIFDENNLTYYKTISKI